MEGKAEDVDIEYVDYTDESMLPDIQKLVAKDLSEPYSVFTYRYFLHQWPSLCICVYEKPKDSQLGEIIGTIICKADHERDGAFRGYIAMLAVSAKHRKKGIGLRLVSVCIQRMIDIGCNEVSLEAEV